MPFLNSDYTHHGYDVIFSKFYCHIIIELRKRFDILFVYQKVKYYLLSLFDASNSVKSKLHVFA